METSLHPKPRPVLRLVLFILLVAFISISTAAWVSKLAMAAWMALFFGSYRVARLKDGWFERQMVFMFIPLKCKRWQLEKFIEIETAYEEGLHVGWALLIGPAMWLWSRFLDWALPWLGGNYQLRLRHVKGRPVVVWQGSSDNNFQANVEILKNNTGLPLRRV